jgi:hypothetical protein
MEQRTGLPVILPKPYHSRMSTLELIVSELKTLPPPKLEEAAVLIHRLTESSHADRAEALRRTAGVWSGARGEAIEKTIEEGCERIGLVVGL